MSALGFRSTYVKCPKCGDAFPAYPVNRKERISGFKARCLKWTCRETSDFTSDDLIQSVVVGASA